MAKGPYVVAHGLPVVAIFHAPHLATSDSPVHVHGAVLLQRLSLFGWLNVSRDVTSDTGFLAAQAARSQFKIV